MRNGLANPAWHGACPFWHNTDPTDARHRNLHAVRFKDWRLVKYPDGWRLFDLKKDPEEKEDLSRERAGIVDRMRTQYDAFVARCLVRGVGREMMDMKRKRGGIRRGIIACVLVGVAVVVGVKWQTCLRAVSYHTPVEYDKPFGPAIAGADRVVIRADGFDCCGPVDETNILFIVTEPDRISDVAKHISFVSRTTTNSLWESCMCCGGPGIDWYKGKKRIVFTAMQHGHAIRWRGFSTMRILGFRVGYGDGPLTENSQAWLKEWFKSHGIGREEEMGAASNQIQNIGTNAPHSDSQRRRGKKRKRRRE